MPCFEGRVMIQHVQAPVQATADQVVCVPSTREGILNERSPRLVMLHQAERFGARTKRGRVKQNQERTTGNRFKQLQMKI